MSRTLALLCLPLLLAGPARAESVLDQTPGAGVVIAGNSGATDCSSHARLAADGKMSPAFAVETCTAALTIEPLSQRDRSATYTNRGVLYMTMASLAAARADFDDAVKLDPALSEAYVNRGATLLALGQPAAGLADLDRGIALGGLKEPWKAYFNRAIAYEKLDDVKAAYADYSRAAALKPDWAEPKAELARFSVRR